MTDAEYQELIQVETGTVDNLTVQTYLPSWWSVYTGQPNKDLQSLYTKLRVAQYLAGQARTKKDITQGPDSIKASQEFANAMKLVEDIKSDIKDAQKLAGVGNGLVTAQPITSLPDTLSEEVKIRKVWGIPVDCEY
jgi:hypothetical protein